MATTKPAAAINLSIVLPSLLRLGPPRQRAPVVPCSVIKPSAVGGCPQSLAQRVEIKITALKKSPDFVDRGSVEDADEEPSIKGQSVGLVTPHGFGAR